jgi:hypothetical protein
METYQGVLTQEERADAERLRREFASRILILTFGQSERLLAEPNTFYAGSISEDAVEAHISGIVARLPWEAVTAYAGVQGTVLLLAGQVCLPVARSLFAGDESWQAARAIIEKKVLRAPKSRWALSDQWKAVIVWVVLLTLMYLAWHFRQMPHAR